METSDKFISNENKEHHCDICGEAHKTSHHDKSLLEKTELLNPVCNICKGGHETSQHDKYELERISKLNPIKDK